MLKVRTVSEKDFEDFKKYVLEVVDLLGLVDWLIAFDKRKLKDNNAEIAYSPVGKICTITISTQIVIADTVDKSLKRLAKHEVIEGLLLGKLSQYACGRCKVYEDEQVDEEVHRIVRILEKRILLKGEKLT